MVKGNNSTSYCNNRCVDDSGLFLWVSTTASLAEAREVPSGTVRPKLLILGLVICTRVYWGHFGPTETCRGLLGQFLWPRAHTVLYCACTWIFPWNWEHRVPVKTLSVFSLLPLPIILHGNL